MTFVWPNSAYAEPAAALTAPVLKTAFHQKEIKTWMKGKHVLCVCVYIYILFLLLELFSLSSILF